MNVIIKNSKPILVNVIVFIKIEPFKCNMKSNIVEKIPPNIPESIIIKLSFFESINIHRSYQLINFLYSLTATTFLAK